MAVSTGLFRQSLKALFWVPRAFQLPGNAPRWVNQVFPVAVVGTVWDWVRGSQFQTTCLPTRCQASGPQTVTHFLLQLFNLVWVPEFLVSWHKPVAAPCLASLLLSPCAYTLCGCGKNPCFSTQCSDEAGMPFPTQNRSLLLWSQDVAFPKDHEWSNLSPEFTFFQEVRRFPKNIGDGKRRGLMLKISSFSVREWG